jgi:glycerol dehydrogenase-like iron-containing ADH family enzyme
MITYTAPIIPAEKLIVSSGQPTAVRTALYGYEGALVVLDPELREAFLAHLLPLLQECLPTVQPLIPGHRVANGGVVVAFGGGTVLDTAKLRAAELGLDWIAVPTKPTAAAFSATASVKDERGVVTEIVSPPRHVLVMPDIMAHTPLELLQAEIADTWSFQTAMADVALDGLANGREWDTAFVPVFNQATRILTPLRAVDLRTPAVLEQFMDVQRMLAEVTNHAHTTRYVSGTEHLIAHSLAAHGCALPHGLLVGIGIVLGRVLQDSTTSVSAELDARGFASMPDTAWRRLKAYARDAIGIGQLGAGLIEQTLHTSKFIRLDHRYTVLDSVSGEACRAALRGVCNNWAGLAGGLAKEEERCS